MQIFEFTDYKAFLKATIKALPKAGRGQASRLAAHLNVHSVVVSQILSGSRDLNPEQALQTAAFFALDEPSTDYLVNLVQQARAGTVDLRAFYGKKLTALRAEALNLKNRVVEHRSLGEEDKGIFYSNWYYSGIRLLCGLNEFDNMDSIANYLGLSRQRVADVLEFLISRGLVVQKDGRLKVGVTATYVDSTSRYVNSHRRNWRLKAIDRLAEPGPHDLFYASPMTISETDAEIVRKELVKVIAEVSKRVSQSQGERTACLNIDWFRF